MDHHRAFAGAVFRYIFQFKPLWQVVIHLHGSKLPFPLQRILENKIQLRTVKRGFANAFKVIHAQGFHGTTNRPFRFFPGIIRADVFIRSGIAKTETGAEVFKLEAFENFQNQIHDAKKFCIQLFRGDEEV